MVLASVPVTVDTVNIPTSPSGGRFPILSGPSSNQVRINVLDIQSGATFTQTGSYFILHKDLIIRSGGTFNQLSGNLLLYNDWINKGTFTSVAGWVTLGNQTSLSDFATGVNEFYDLSISTGETPKFDNFPSSLIKIKGGLYNYGNYNVSSAATFLFNGTGTQPIYNQTAAGNATLGNFVIDKSAGSVILVTKLLEISGNATVTNGTFNIDTCSFQRTISGGTLVLSNSSTLKIGGTKGMPTSFATRTFSPSSTVEYSGTNQIISSENYGNLTLSGSGTKTFAAGTTSISGNFSVTLPPPPYAPIGNYSKNYNPNYQTASVLGDITINTTTNSSNIDYNGNGDQTVLAIDYYDLTLSNSGTKIFDAGTVGIGGDLNVTGSALVDAVTDNDTVKYFGTNKTVRYGFVNKNLKIDDNTSVTAGANIPVNNSLVISSGATLDMAGYVLTADSVIINDGTLISTNPAGIMSFYSKNTGNYNLLTSWANSGYNGTNTPRLPGTINNDVLIIGNGKTITLTSNVSNLGTIRVESTGALSTGAYILSGKGKFDLRSGGTLKIGSADGISSSGSTGSIQTAIRSFSSAANYEYNGTSAQSTGNGLPSTVNNLLVNNSSGVLLSNSTKLNGNLSLLQGRLTLADKNLTLGSTSSIVGTPSSSNMVVATGSGQLRKEFLGIGAFTFPVGDNDGTAEFSPVTLDFTSGTFASAYAGVRLVNAKHPQNTSTSNYLNRYWTVASSGITAFSCNVTFTYVDADVQPGGTESSIYGAQYEGSWSLLDPVNPSMNQISYSVSSFSDFTGGESSALPVELVSFNASVKENSVYLSWKTATEVNNYGFEIERQILKQVQNDKNNNWEKIGFVNGYGNSNSLKEYAFEDSKLSSAAYYYRLKQMDNDGSFSYSNIVNITVDYSPNSFALSQNYPNPFNPSTKISWQSPVGSWQTLKVYDILGNEVAALVNEFREAGFYEVEFSGSQLTSGVYIYKIQVYPANDGTGGFSETRKMLLTK